MKNSLYVKLINYLLIVAVLGSILLAASNFYSVKVGHDTVSQTYQNSLNLFSQDISAELDNAATYLNVFVNTVDAQQFCYLEDDYFIRCRVQENLNGVLQLEKYISGLWIYSSQNGRVMSIRSAGRSDFAEKEKIMELVYDEVHWADYANDVWQEIVIDGESYLIYLNYGKGRCYGAWCRTAYILQKAREYFEDDIAIRLTHEALPAEDWWGIRLAGSINERQHLYVEIRAESILKKYDFLIGVILGFSILCIGMIVGIMNNMRRYLLRPVKEIIKSIRNIGSGNLKERIQTEGYVMELQEIGDSLNTMTESISDLKIAVYEEELQKKDAQMQFYNSQIKPHFMLNMINTIYNMASVGEVNMIMKSCKYLSGYMRYVFSSKKMLCSIEEEILHIQEYVQLQKLRFSEQVDCELRIDQQIISCEIPTMALHSLVENSFKHGMGGMEKLIVLVEGEYLPGQEKVCIRVMDNGPGFPEEMIEKVRQKGYRNQKNNASVGMWNTIQRFYELYGEEFSIEINNSPMTVVKLTFPLREHQED